MRFTLVVQADSHTVALTAALMRPEHVDLNNKF